MERPKWRIGQRASLNHKVARSGSSILSSRIVKRFDAARTLEDLSYGKSMKVLERAKKVRIDGKWNLVRLTVKDSEILTDLGFIPKIIEVKNPRGRPRKKRS